MFSALFKYIAPPQPLWLSLVDNGISILLFLKVALKITLFVFPLAHIAAPRACLGLPELL